MNARNVAYKILLDIEKNKNYSNLSLNYFLKNSNLNDIDRGFTTELVYGVLENKIFIDYVINKYSKIKVKKMQYSIKISLRMGVYQLLFLDGVADYAAINETVDMVKKIDKRSSNFVNAILRSISKDKDNLFRIDENSVENLSIKYSYEKWIINKLVDENGFDETREILKSLSEKPKIYLRVNRLKSNEFSSFDDCVNFIIDKLKKFSINAKRVEGIEEAIEVENFKNIEKNNLFIDGYVSIQDISSMMVAKIMNPKKESLVLDLCAAPGGKSTHIAEIMENTGRIISQDIFEHKLKLISNYCDRLGITNIETRLSSAEILNEEYIGKFDYVLCDVPCSGMGIVRRKPEIKYKKEEDFNSLSKIQYSILSTAAKYVKKGGILMYSTCTIFNEENIEIVNKFLKNNKDFVFDELKSEKFYPDKCINGSISIMPNIDEMDGFFISKMKKI